MDLETPKAPRIKRPRASRGWEMGRGYFPPQPTRGSVECRKLRQRVPGQSPGDKNDFAAF